MTNPIPASVSPDLAVAVLTKDNIRTIGRTLESVRGLADRIVVVDSGSTDGTLEVCREVGAEVIHREWPGHSAQRQFVIDHCANHRWILALDSDESLDDDLQRSVMAAVTNDDSRYAGWMINRKIWFLGGWLQHTFQPEWRLRLVRGGIGRVEGSGRDNKGNHDRIVVSGRTGKLEGFCRHDSWSDLTDLCHRQIRYAEDSARHNPNGGRMWNILVNPTAAFLKQFIIKRGFLDGKRGIMAACAVTSGTLLKHLFIAERRFMQRSNDDTPNDAANPDA